MRIKNLVLTGDMTTNIGFRASCSHFKMLWNVWQTSLRIKSLDIFIALVHLKERITSFCLWKRVLYVTRTRLAFLSNVNTSIEHNFEEFQKILKIRAALIEKLSIQLWSWYVHIKRELLALLTLSVRFPDFNNRDKSVAWFRSPLQF